MRESRRDQPVAGTEFPLRPRTVGRARAAVSTTGETRREPVPDGLRPAKPSDDGYGREVLDVDGQPGSEPPDDVG